MTASYLVVGNPTAQSGRARAHIERALDRMGSRGLRATFLATEPRGGTTERVRRALDERGFDVVAALGGDGTLAEVARGVLAARQARPLALLPLGTANNVARSLGLREGLDALDDVLDVVAAGATRALDVGELTCLEPGRAAGAATLFVSCAGFGMQPEILAVRNRDRAVVAEIPLLRDLYRDEAVYAGAALNRYLASWVEPTKFAAEVTADGRTRRFEGLTDLIVTSTPVYAGAWVLDPNSEPDDGRFELVAIAGRRDWFVKAAGSLAMLPLRAHLDGLGIHTDAPLPGADFDLRLLRPARPAVASQVDGEEWVEGARFRVRVLPGRLAVIAPRGFAPPWRAGG